MLDPRSSGSEAQPTYSNVVSGQADVGRLLASPHSMVGVQHNYSGSGIKFGCGHSGMADEVALSGGESVKVCVACYESATRALVARNREAGQ